MMRYFKYLLIVLMVTSCGTVVNYDYERSTDFKQYKTYNYFDDMKPGLSQLDTKRLIRAMDSKLESIGLTRSENPDFFIDLFSQDIQSGNNSNVGIGVGGTGRNTGGGVSVGLPLGGSNLKRELIIEFVDDKRGGMFWQAISESAYSAKASPEERQAQFDELIEKIFKAYPPQTKN